MVLLCDNSQDWCGLRKETWVFCPSGLLLKWASRLAIKSRQCLFSSHDGPPLTSQTICTLVEAFPEFSDRWRKHLAYCGEPAGSYNDIAELVHFVVEDLYEKGRTSEVRRVFELLEALFVEGEQTTRDLIGLGFFETVQNFASRRPCGNKVFEQFLGPMSKRCWKEIQRQWAGKSSLMDVIRSERRDG